MKTLTHNNKLLLRYGKTSHIKPTYRTSVVTNANYSDLWVTGQLVVRHKRHNFQFIYLTYN